MCRSERGASASARTSARRTVVRVVRFPVGSFLSIDCAAAFDLLSISVPSFLHGPWTRAVTLGF
jgi:hypothetical protein